MNKRSLTARYQELKDILIKEFLREDAETRCHQELDELYDRIVHAPVDNIDAAIEKLRFAHHCLTEEQDFKETENLLCQVRDALETLEKRG